MILAYDSVYGLMMTRKVNADQLVIFYSHSLEMCSPRDMAYKITYSSGTVKWLDWEPGQTTRRASLYCRDVAGYDTILDISACVAGIDIDSPTRGQYGYNQCAFRRCGGARYHPCKFNPRQMRFQRWTHDKAKRASWYGSKGRKRDQPCPFWERGLFASDT